MKKLSGIAGTLAIVSIGVLAQEAQRPTYNVGDTWVYERTDKTKNVVEGGRENRLIAKSDSEYRYESKNLQSGIPQSFATNLDGNTTETGGRNWTPSIPNFQWPLTVGKKWEGKYGGTNQAGSGPYSEERKCEVAAQEPVQVKAGTFSAFKIVCTGWYRTPNSSGQVTLNGQTWITYWYAQDARRSVKIEYRDASQFGPWNNWADELVSFELKK